MRPFHTIFCCLLVVSAMAGQDNDGLVILKTNIKFDDLDTLTERAKGGKIHFAGNGSGFFVTTNGYVVTNHHVVDGAEDLIMVWRETAYLMVVEDVDREKDLALLKPALQRHICFPDYKKSPYPAEYLQRTFPPLKVSESRSYEVGDTIYVVGYPKIGLQGLEAKVTKGIVSSLSGFMGQKDNFQMDAAIQGGNSGGPVVDEKGRLVGVSVAHLRGGENVNYAIKLNEVEKFLGRNSMHFLESPSSKRSGNMVRKVVDSTVLILNYQAGPRPLSVDVSGLDRRARNEATARLEKTILYAKLLKVKKEWKELKKLTDALIKELGKDSGDEIKELNDLAKERLGGKQNEKGMNAK